MSMPQESLAPGSADPASIVALRERGFTLHGQGDLGAAERAYRDVLQRRPDDYDVMHALGVLAVQSGRFGEAVELIAPVIRHRESARFHTIKGLAHAGLEQREQAIDCFDAALTLEPDYVPAHVQRGIALRQLGRPMEAMASLDRAIALQPEFEDAHFHRGNVLVELKRWNEARLSYDRAIGIKADFAQALNNRGGVFKELGQWEAALEDFNKAIRLDAGFAQAYANRGNVHTELQRWEAALADYAQAIALDPRCADAHCNRGALFHQLNQWDAALASYDWAIEIRPGFAQAHYNRSLTLLLTGDFAKGWAEHEWRWENVAGRALPARRFVEPLWLGDEPLAGKTILLHAEQGLGDTLQFCRYAKEVGDLGAHVILEVPAALERLLATLQGVSQRVVSGAGLPAFDYHCPLMSLPLALKTTLSTIPAHVPYLRGRARDVLTWKERLGETRKLRVGLVWSGGLRANQPHVWSVNRRRNIPLSKLAPLEHPDIEFYSLQQGTAAELELRELELNRWKGPKILDFTNLLHDLSDTAALIENLDLVISVDTSIAHLTGALGKPVWILSRFDGCWRWLAERSDSPWYPTATLYRQARPGDWDEVIQRVRSELVRFAVGDLS